MTESVINAMFNHQCTGTMTFDLCTANWMIVRIRWKKGNSWITHAAVVTCTTGSADIDTNLNTSDVNARSNRNGRSNRTSGDGNSDASIVCRYCTDARTDRDRREHFDAGANNNTAAARWRLSHHRRSRAVGAAPSAG